MKKVELKKLLKEWAKYQGLDQTSENIEKGNKLFLELENNLPFMNSSQKERWQDYASWFTNFDDFYNFTLAIIDHKDYFYDKERYEYNCDEWGNSNEGYYEYHHCWWCGEVVNDAKYINKDYICEQCKVYLNSREGEC